MHIANHRGPLTFIEVTICGISHIMRVLKMFSKFTVFTLRSVSVLENWPFLGGFTPYFDHF